MLKEEVKVIGIGNCGCKIAKEFWKKDYDTMFINGSEQDLLYLGKEIPRHNIKKLKGFDGFGGDTKKGMESLSSNLEVVQAIQDINEEIVFVVASGAGSTGSGLLEAVISILSGDLEENLDGYNKEWYQNRIIMPIICMPYEDEAILKQANAYQLGIHVMRLEQIGATIIVDNNSNIDKRGGYDRMNRILVESIDLFLSDDSVGDKNNFDSSEKKKMMRDKGAFVLCLSRFKEGNKKQSLTQEKDDILSAIKEGSVFAAIEDDGVCGNIAILHRGDDDDDIKINDIAGLVGNPMNSFEGFNTGETLVVISGLTYPITLFKKMSGFAKEGQLKRNEKRRSLVLDDLDDLEDEIFSEEVSVPIPKLTKKQENSSNQSLMALRERMNKRKTK